MSSEDEAAFSSAKSDSKRIDLIHKQIGLLWSDLTRLRRQIDTQQNEVTDLLSRVDSHVHSISGDTDNTKHTIEMLEREVNVIKNSVQDRLTLSDLRREIDELKSMLTHNKDFKELLEVMNWKMSDHHEDIHEGMFAVYLTPKITKAIANSTLQRLSGARRSSITSSCSLLEAILSY